MGLFKSSKKITQGTDHGGEKTTVNGEIFHEGIPLIPLRDTVVYPHTVVPVYVDENIGLPAAKLALEQDGHVAVFSQKPGVREVPELKDLYKVGTLCQVHKIVPVSNQGTMVILQGVARVVLVKGFDKSLPWISSVEQRKEIGARGTKVDALAKTVLTTAQGIISQMPYLPHQELHFALESLDDPLKLVYLVGTVIGMKVEEKQKLLSLKSVKGKLGFLIKVLTREDELLQIGGKIQDDIRKDFSKSQREYFLRQKLKAIQKELGEDSETVAEANEYRMRMKKRKLPKHVVEEVGKELDRLELMSPMSAEYQVVRTYLDWVFDVPWDKTSKEVVDINKAQKVLDADHYGMKEPKERLLEYLSVRALSDKHVGPILCFAGPPGVGKTSLGKSIAKALNREFVRVSLGGVHDESEIRGHRRTYIGAMPGRIVQGLKRAGTNNPVFMLDEIDKMTSSAQGDPSAALLEVLDPEQNNSFKDHYLDLDFDLSNVMFIATANTLDTLPPALLDRLEVISLSGYIEDEKVEIAKRYLWPKQREKHGLSAASVKVSDSVFHAVISGYTREAGVRNLERALAKVCRKVAWAIVHDGKSKVNVTASSLVEFLGPQKLFPEVARRVAHPGVATGLGVTSAGGELLFVEATAMPGKEKFMVTGQLGNVMKESAQAAYSLVKSRYAELAIDVDFFKTHDVHVHVPAGAIPKDGPSAGVAMVVALASMASGVRVRNDVAMTGEISLSGFVLPVGGIKEKVIAAKQGGVGTVLLPVKNKPDVEEIDSEVCSGIEIVFCDSVDEVLSASLLKD